MLQGVQDGPHSCRRHAGRLQGEPGSLQDAVRSSIPVGFAAYLLLCLADRADVRTTPGPPALDVGGPFLFIPRNPPMHHRHPRGAAVVALLAALGVLILFVLFAATCDQKLAERRHWAEVRPVPVEVAGLLP